MHKFDLFFSGQLLPNQDSQQVKAALVERLRIPADKVEALFSGRKVRIKADVDLETASKYRELFRGAGALIEVVALEAEPDEIDEAGFDPRLLEAAGKDWELLPARTGSLIGLAKPRPPIQLPSLNHIFLAPAGALLPESPPLARRNVDTSSMSLADTGSLLQNPEDSARTFESVPDISHLGEPEEIGNLEEFVIPLTPPPPPNTDHLQLERQEQKSASDEPRLSVFEVD